MEISPEIVITALSALGVGAIVPKVISGLVGYFTGRQARERAGWEAADRAIKERREWEQWGHRVQSAAITHRFEHLIPIPPATDGFPRHTPTPSSIIEPPKEKP